MKMAIRLDVFERGLDQEITILDLKPRMTVEAFEHAALQPQNESLCENVLDEIDARHGKPGWLKVSAIADDGAIHE